MPCATRVRRRRHRSSTGTGNSPDKPVSRVIPPAFLSGLAIPPDLFATVVRGLGASGCATAGRTGGLPSPMAIMRGTREGSSDPHLRCFPTMSRRPHRFPRTARRPILLEPSTEGHAMHRYLLFLVLLCACSSHARTLHKCSGQGGTIAYRDGGCLPSERLVAVRDAAADIHSPQQRPPRPGHEPNAPRRTTRASKDSGTTREYRHDRRRVARNHARRRKAAKDPCSAAKQARDDFQRKRGIKVTMAQLSRWNHRVYDACK